MKKRSQAILAAVLIDTLLFAICLLSFAYLHHVRRMWSSGSGGVIIVGQAGENGGDENSNGNSNSSSAAPGGETNTADDPASAPADGTSGGTEPETEPEPEPEPNKFESLFAPEGTFEVTDSYYHSHDIYITVEEVTGPVPVSDYIARYYVYDVYVRNIENLFAVAVMSEHPSDDTDRVPFDDLIAAAGSPIAAISGDYWGFNADVAVRNGVLLRNRGRTEDDFCVMYRDGRMETHPGSDLPGFEITDDVYQIWNFGPSLLDDLGCAKTDFGSKNDIKNRNPRSSIGYYEPGHYCFIVAEGRRTIKYNGQSTYLAGIRFVDLSAIYEQLGVTAAYNFDGGDSAYAYYNGETIRQDWSRAHEPGETPRRIYDIICVGEIEK